MVEISEKIPCPLGLLGENGVSPNLELVRQFQSKREKYFKKMLHYCCNNTFVGYSSDAGLKTIFGINDKDMGGEKSGDIASETDEFI